MSPIAWTSEGVSRCVDERKQDDRSLSAQDVLPSAPDLNRLGDTHMNRSTARNGIHSRARSTARRIRRLAGPSGRRAPESLNPDVCNRASAKALRERLV
jgi:hypothetical protein